MNSAGRLSGQLAKDPVARAPFAFMFDPVGRLALVNTLDSSPGTYTINADGTLTTVRAGLRRPGGHPQPRRNNSIGRE